MSEGARVQVTVVPAQSGAGFELDQVLSIWKYQDADCRSV